ncbi:MAG: A24 family peptidase [Parvularculaceae bacterium]
MLSAWVIYTTVFIAGLAIGSFVNVVIYRGPTLWGLVDAPARGDLAFPRSYCPSCRTTIRIAHLIPLAGYVAAHGKCAECAAPIPLRYPLVELTGGVAAVLSVALFGLTLTAGAAFVFFMLLLALAFIDLETGYLPDALVIPLLLAGAGANGFGLFTDPLSAAIGALSGYAVFAGVGWLFIKMRGKEGLGLGDAKLLAAFGAWFGWAALPFIVFVGAMTAILAVLSLRATGKHIKSDTPIPFGPALAAAGALAMIVHGLGVSFF